jgi:hypothetical protein
MTDLTAPLDTTFRRQISRVQVAPFRFNHRLAFYMAIVLLCGFLGPSEASIKAGLNLTTLRIAVLIAMVPVLLEFSRKIVRGGYVPVVSDFAVFMLAAWMLFGLYVIHGPKGAASASALAGVEFLVAYLVGRCFCGTYAGAEQFVSILAGFAIVLLLIGFVDVAAHDNILARIASKIFGTTRSLKIGNVTVEYRVQFRFGLVRVRGPFEQSIHFGTFFAMLVPLFWYVLREKWQRIVMLGVAIVGTLLSISSAAVISCLLILSFIAYDVGLNRSRWRWALLVVAAAYCAVLFGLLIDDPLAWLISGLTFNPQTGFYRLQQWYWVGYNLELSPFFGIGDKDWVRPLSVVSSLDSLWLVFATRHGYVGVALLLLAIVGSWFVWTPRQTPLYPHPRARQIGRAVAMALIGAIFVTFTVHFWAKIWLFLALIVGVRAGLSEARYLHPSVRGDEAIDGAPDGEIQHSKFNR